MEYLADCDKTYRAEILFGISTDSGDLDGKIIAQQKNFSMPTSDELQIAAEKFIGEIEQTPPKFSAIKINGRKAYDLARKNIDFEIPKRLVKIYRLEILSVEKNIVTVEVDCSKGTYIRSLAEDFGKSLNLPATLKSLQRIRFGNFLLKNSAAIDEIQVDGKNFLLPVEECLNFDKFFLPAHRVKAFLNGLSTDLNKMGKQGNEKSESFFVRVYADKKFLGVGKISAGQLRSAKVFLDS